MKANMKKLKAFEIQFVGLKEGEHHFDYKIDKTFFDLFDFDEFNDSQVEVKVKLLKKATLLELNFNAEGAVNVNCDLSNESFDLAIANSFDLVVKFGEHFNDDNEEILILPHGEYQINIAQFLYELIVLAVPAKRIHPGVINGSLNSEILKRLEQLAPDGLSENHENEDTDPRWDKLKNLLTDK